MPMPRIANIIHMESTKKILILAFITLIFVISLFFGQNYLKNQSASLWDIITAWVTINPLEVNVSAPFEVEINKVFKVEAKLINKGEEKIENAKGEIFLPEGLVLIQKDPVKKTGIIPPKKDKKISWSVKGEKTGSYIITVSGSGELRGQAISAEASTRVEVRKSLRGAQPRWFQNLLDFFQKQFRF